MSLRHATALALVGWYLMVPPPNTDPKRPQALIDGAAPISRWVVRGEFDSERDCETARDILRDEVWHSKLDTKDRTAATSYAQNELAHCDATASDEAKQDTLTSRLGH
jgi:hypothetical protein